MHNDFLNELQELALGSRLKRISERMLASAAQVYEEFGMDINPKWFTLLALLDSKGKVTIVEASQLLGLSQPALSQFCKELLAAKLIKVEKGSRDSRQRELSLSLLGAKRLREMKPIWEQVKRAAVDLCSQDNNQFYASLLKFENAFNQRDLLERTREYMKADKTKVEIIDYDPALAPLFYSINAQWIKDMFVLEEIDKQVLGNPQHYIIDNGGHIWFASAQSGRMDEASQSDLNNEKSNNTAAPIEHNNVVGTCAILKRGEGAFELTKMGVLSSARGLKVGEILLQHVIKQAKLMQVSDLFLLTNKKCEAAIHLYEKNGFEHSQRIMDEYGAMYSRCDVAMEYVPTA